MSQSDLKESRKFLFVVVVLMIMSLGVAFVLFYFLHSVAKIEKDGISAGGAIAGFLIIFWLSQHFYFKGTKTERYFKNLSTDEKIKQLQQQVEQLVTSKLDNFVVPKGYKGEISKEFQFGFCYPENWAFSKFPQETKYGVVRDESSAKTTGFARNFNVIITNISDMKDELTDIYKNTQPQLLRLLPNPKLIFGEDFLLQGMSARRYRVDWMTNEGDHLVLYQILVADKKRKNVYIISCTTKPEDFDSSRILFDNIASTFRI